VAIEFEWTAVTLVPDSMRSTDAAPIEGLVKVGRLIPMDAVDLLRGTGRNPSPAVTAQRTEHAFCVLSVPLSFRASAAAELSLVTVEVALHAGEGAAYSWSMDPVRVTASRRSGCVPRLTADLELEPGASDGGQDFEWEPDVEAFDLRSAVSSWELRPGPGRPLSGLRMLHLVAAYPRRSPWTGQVKLTADIRRGQHHLPHAAHRADDHRDVIQSFAMAPPAIAVPHPDAMDDAIDVFVAHATPDTAIAEGLYDALRRLRPDVRTYIATRDLVLGDPWDIVLPRALRRARVIALVISEHTDSAWYLRTEIAEAIDQVRAPGSSTRCVPCFVGSRPAAQSSVPYGVRILHGLSLAELGNEGAAAELATLVDRARTIP